MTALQWIVKALTDTALQEAAGGDEVAVPGVVEQTKAEIRFALSAPRWLIVLASRIPAWMLDFPAVSRLTRSSRVISYGFRTVEGNGRRRE